MSADPNKKSARTFQCRDVLWETFEQMARELECSVDYLINESMKQYARQRSYGASRTPFPGRPAANNPETSQPPPPAFASAPAPMYAPPRQSAVPPPARLSMPMGPPSQRVPPPPMRGGGGLPTPPPRQFVPLPPPQARGMGAQLGSQSQLPSPSQGLPMPIARSVPPAARSVPPPIPGGSGGPFGGPGARTPAPPPLAMQSGAMQGVPMASNGFAPAVGGHGAQLSVFYQGEKMQVAKDRFVIGRGKQSSDLTLKDPNVSRQHAMIEFQNGVYFMVDMGSTNGVEFNGQRIARKQIGEGDVFKICDHEMRFTYR